MQLIDTHAHLYLEQFNNDYEDVISRAIKAGVSHIILPNVDETTIEPMVNLHKLFPNTCIPAMAIHPTSAKGNSEEKIELVYRMLKEGCFCAVGETGIDLYWDRSYYKEQCFLFEKHIELSLQNNLPLIVHSRNSLDEIFSILDKYKGENLRGVFHCFPGNIDQAAKVVELGFLIGIGGVVTFRNSEMIKVAEAIDLENILLETDAPYLAPVPKRGKRNESSYLAYIARKVAEIKEMSIDNVAAVTTGNAIDLFGLDS